jgi:transposase
VDQLFRVDRVARETSLTLETRHALSSEESRPILERIKVRIEAARIGALPQSARTKACQYTLKLWNRLTRFLDHPELELSNNAAENSMRPVAIGRNN